MLREQTSGLLVEASYTYTTCHPTRPEVVTYDAVLSEAQACTLFEQYPWAAELATADGLAQDDLHYSPSLEIKRLYASLDSLTFSELEATSGVSFYVFYVAPGADLQSGGEGLEQARSYLDLLFAGRIVFCKYAMPLQIYKNQISPPPSRTPPTCPRPAYYLPAP